MKKAGKVILLGAITWLIPFIISILFYSKAGELRTDLFLFKQIMIISGTITGELALIYYFNYINDKFLRGGIIIGLSWLLINWFLDFIILLPMSKMRIDQYFEQIGLEYVIIFIMAAGTGYILDRKKV